MSARAQVIINLPSLMKMLMEDVAWVSDHCSKQARISIAGQVQSSRGRLWQESATLQFIPGMFILVLVLVLKDSLRTFFKSLSLSWSLGVRSLSLSLSLGVRVQ